MYVISIEVNLRVRQYDPFVDCKNAAFIGSEQRDGSLERRVYKKRL